MNKTRRYAVERRFKVCREEGWRVDQPGPWTVVGDRATRAAGRELLGVLNDFNLSIENGSVAEYRVRG